MTHVGVHEAKTHLSQLLKRVAAGEEIIIARSGKPVARLVPEAGSRRRQLGRDQGLFQIPENFDAPLAEEVLKDFET